MSDFKEEKKANKTGFGSKYKPETPGAFSDPKQNKPLTRGLDPKEQEKPAEPAPAVKAEVVAPVQAAAAVEPPVPAENQVTTS